MGHFEGWNPPKWGFARGNHPLRIAPVRANERSMRVRKGQYAPKRPPTCHMPPSGSLAWAGPWGPAGSSPSSSDFGRGFALFIPWPVRAAFGQSRPTEAQCRRKMRTPERRRAPNATLQGPRSPSGGYATHVCRTKIFRQPLENRSQFLLWVPRCHPFGRI